MGGMVVGVGMVMVKVKVVMGGRRTTGQDFAERRKVRLIAEPEEKVAGGVARVPATETRKGAPERVSEGSATCRARHNNKLKDDATLHSTAIPASRDS